MSPRKAKPHIGSDGAASTRNASDRQPRSANFSRRTRRLAAVRKPRDIFLRDLAACETESDRLLPVSPARLHAKQRHEQTKSPRQAGQLEGISAMNDNEERPVTIITGRVWRRKGGKPEGVHVLLAAPDDDSAVRSALDALTSEGYRRSRARPDRRHGGRARRGAASVGLSGRARRRGLDRDLRREGTLSPAP